MTEETQYEVDNPTDTKALFAKRWVRITGISLAVTVALVSAFGAGVIAGERIGSNSNGGFNGQAGFGGHDDFGGKSFPDRDGFPGGASGDARFGGPQGEFPGGCPADDPDNCAGTDRGEQGFQLPEKTTTGSTGTKS